MANNPATTVTNPRIGKLIELEVSGRIKPEHQQELDTYRAQGLAPKKAASSLTETQGKNTGFYARALEADQNYLAASGKKDAAGNPVDIGPVGIAGDAARAVLPPGVVNSFASDERQKAEQAKRNFIAATLRAESGAAINAEEYANQEKIFFPQAGDSDEVIAQKAADRKVAMEALRASAGGGADQITRDKPTNDPAASGVVGRGDIGFNYEPPPSPLDDKQSAAYDAFWKANPDATADDLRAFGRSIGANIANADEIVKARAAGQGVAPASSAIYDFSDIDKARSEGGIAAGADVVVRGAADSASLGLSDEIAAAGNTLFGDRTMRENLARERYTDKFDETNSPWLRGIGQLAGAVAPVGVGAIGAGVRGARDTAILGGGLGAAYGFNSGDTLANRFMGAGAGLAAGSAGGLAIGKLSDFVGSRLARSRVNRAYDPAIDEGIATAEAAQAEGVPISRPIVDPKVRDRMSYLESSFGSGAPVQNSLAATERGIAERASTLAGGGTAQEPGMLGSAIQEAGDRFIDRSRSVGRRLYDRAASLAGDNTVLANDAIAKIDQHIAELSENANANGPQIAYLREIRADLANEAGAIPKSVASIRDLRTGLRGQINNRNLTATDAERRVGEVLDAARGDITRSLGDKSPEAVRAYERADKFWGERSDEIRQVVQRFIGKKDDKLSGEQVYSRIMSMAKPNGDSVRLRRMIDKLDPDERADFTATIASGLGRRSADEDFSPAVFINQARAISPAARRTVFGQDGAQSIENLIQVSKALKDTKASLNNSRSGVVVNWRDTLKNALGTGLPASAGAYMGGVPGGAAGVALGAAWTGAGIAIRNLSAKALMNPDLSRWLKNAVAQRDGVMINNYIARLGKIAKNNAPIRAEVTLLQDKLVAAANDNLGRAGSAAASPDRGPDQQQ